MIYLASDIHGHIRLEWLKTQLNKLPLTDSDYLIILGDAGMISRCEHTMSVCLAKPYFWMAITKTSI